jgi:hypothetical protein
MEERDHGLILSHKFGISLEGLTKIIKNLIHDSQCSGSDSNFESPEYK